MNANIGRQWVIPGSWYREIAWIAGAQQQFNYDGDRTDSQAQAYYATPWRQRLTIGVVYLALIGLLVLGMEASYLHRSF